jgi:hypothetical protein
MQRVFRFLHAADVTSGSGKSLDLHVQEMPGRAFHTAVRVGSKMVVFGGQIDGDLSNSLYLVDVGMHCGLSFSLLVVIWCFFILETDFGALV